MGVPLGAMGEVYCLSLGNNQYKIGMSKDFPRRLHDLKAGNPNIKVIEHALVEDMRAVESELHDTFKHHRIEREVFYLPDQQVARARSIIQRNAVIEDDDDMDMTPIFEDYHTRLLPAPGAKHKTRGEEIYGKRLRLCERWAENIYQSATKEHGINFDLPMEAVMSGRLCGLLFNARSDTERLMSFLRSKNSRYLIPFDFGGEPTVTLQGKRVQITVGLPQALVESVVPLPEYWVFSVARLAEGSFTLGVDMFGQEVSGAFDDSMSHLLIGGMSGSGKSEAIRLLVYELCNDGNLILCDAKFGATLRGFDKLDSVLFPLAVTDQQIREVVKWTVAEMERRYQVLYQGENLTEDKLFLVIDELADLSKDILSDLNVLLRKGRQAMIHVIASLQNPTKANLGDLDLKRNFSGRLALRVDSTIASEVILGSRDYDASGLLGRGDAFFFDGQQTKRLQCYYLKPDKAKLAMCHKPRYQFSQDTREKTATASTGDPYREIVERLVTENPRCGQPKVREAIKAEGLPGIGTEKIRDLLKDARGRANQGKLTN